MASNRELLESMCRVEKKVDTLMRMMEKNQSECKKMSRHIDFVEGVYRVARSPLDYVCRKINIISRSDETSPLPVMDQGLLTVD
jgi:glycerol-3-phosphate responsive antiterminator